MSAGKLGQWPTSPTDMRAKNYDDFKVISHVPVGCELYPVTLHAQLEHTS